MPARIPPRLNLICNGMMLFHQVNESTVQIVMPEIDDHIRGICTASDPTQSAVTDLPTGAYKVEGPMGRPGSLVSLISPKTYLVLRKGSVILDQTAAEKVSAIFTVPMPSVVRLFRASEPSKSVFGTTPTDAAYAVPAVHHDVVVFSYVGLSEETEVMFKPPSSSGIRPHTTTVGKFTNWILYSTEKPDTRPPHSTKPLNDLLLLTMDGKHTDFSLSSEDPKDGPPATTGIGASEEHLLAFHELPPSKGRQVGKLSTDSYCSGSVVG